MRHMKLAILVSALCSLAFIGAVSCAEMAANETELDEMELNETEMNRTTFIFIQEGTGGTFVKDESGNYTLTITGVVPYTIYFSDRPGRVGGFAPMDKFLDGFCFGAIDPPNAAVMLREGENESDVVVAELTSPQFDETNSTLTYTAKVLDDYTFNSDWSHIISKADDAIPEAFGNVSIVIDDCPDSFVGCDKSWDEGCGRIKTGCCWHTWDFTCEACHNDEYYVNKCIEKYGEECSRTGDYCGAF